jgi:hypothetical protein
MLHCFSTVDEYIQQHGLEKESRRKEGMISVFVINDWSEAKPFTDIWT